MSCFSLIYELVVNESKERRGKGVMSFPSFCPRVGSIHPSLVPLCPPISQAVMATFLSLSQTSSIMYLIEDDCIRHELRSLPTQAHS